MSDRPRTLSSWVFPARSVSRPLLLAVTVGTAYTAIVYAVCLLIQPERPAWVGEIGLVDTVVVGVLIGFRTKAAYDRWWEGRIVWGELTNQSRNLCLKVVALIDPDLSDRTELARLIGGFPVALTKHLRGQVGLQDVPGFEAEVETPGHVPASIAGRLIRLVARWRADGRIDGHGHQILDTHTSALMAVCGACERIRNTPLPRSYLTLLRDGLLLGLALSPWQLAVTCGAWAIPIQAILIYFLFGIELTAEEVEQPFGNDPDDLPLERYCETIQKNVAEILGLTPLASDLVHKTS